MRTVSCRPIATWLEVAGTHHGIDLGAVLAGLPEPSERLLDPTQRTEWGTVVEVMERLERAFGGPQAWERMVKGKGTPGAQVFVRLIGTLTNYHDAYWIGCSLLGRMFYPHIQFSFRSLDERRIELCYEIPPPYAASAPYHHGTLATLRAYPRIFGRDQAPEALVEAEITPRRARYVVTLPPELTWWQRIRRAGRILRGARTYFSIIDQQHRELEEHFAALTRRYEEERRLIYEVAEADTRAQKRLAADLHDGLGQHLTALGFKALNLAATLDRPLTEEARPALAEEARQLQTLLSQARRQARSIAYGLDPLAEQAGGLAGALREIGETVAEIYALRCTCHADPLPLAPEKARHLYRLAQEAMTNAVRHGHATEITLSFGAKPEGMLCLEITDNGTGFDPAATSTGAGLRNMQHRAHLLGGTLKIESVAGRGTRVCCIAPGG
jgi:signal transduction histidine kinase